MPEQQAHEVLEEDNICLPSPSAFKYKYNDEGYLLDYHGTKVMYPFYESLSVVERFEADPTDVCICNFPKTENKLVVGFAVRKKYLYQSQGANFTAAVVWMIMHDGDPSCISQGAGLHSKVPFLEFSLPLMPTEKTPAYIMNHQKPPRIFHTHLGYDALPKSIKENARLIYVARNPKDVIVSTNYFFRSVPYTGYKCTVEETAQSFIEGNCCYGSFYDHIAGFRRYLYKKSNLFFMTYEEMRQDLEKSVMEMAAFLQKDLDNMQIENVVRHCSFASMKKNDIINHSALDKNGSLDFSVSPFMRKGEVGDWKRHFSPQLDAEINVWIKKEEKRVSEDLYGFSFQYE